MMLIPGPVNVPQSVAFAATRVVNHRSDEFRQVVKNLEELMSEHFNSARTALLTGSGTLAVESMVFSLLKKKEKVIVLTYGEFSNRLLDSIKRRETNTIVYSKKFGEGFSTEEVKKIVEENKDADAVAIVHNETSTGIAFRNLGEISKIVKDSGKKFLVDSVSGFAAYEIKVNKWNIDAVATGSQKALASVPGMGFVALSEEGIENLNDDVPNYLNLKLALKFQDKHETPFTPSTGAFYASLRAAELLKIEGIERRWKRHEACARFLRNVTSKLGFSLFGNEYNFSNTVVAGIPPITPKNLISALRERGIEISGGMGELKEKIVRIGILGVVDDRAMNRLTIALADIFKQDINDKPPEDCKLPESIRNEVIW
ncbi:aminotransferase class V-fold PLP-dependent enzyme [Acidianus sulfidivorans JP7]|uniref:Hydrogenase expression protein HypE n=1 Tax=Acidianus sulfidivorans JP7 TaxID=619593 RepID=A0A2U9INZ1_9CREN|nr:aminotransferase class V-fold PLP-dependent enzyme [Acidianus sulfidivorans]AWR97750.1 aminotransferase class V-fold PLP-dependent enzyme [Acidianus sulfidivorans JP7]